MENGHKKGFTHESPVNETTEWYTPAWIFEKLGLKFDLDPCHSRQPIKWIPAAKTFTIDDNGLLQKWTGLVWLNPPYGRMTTSWLKKMHEHRQGVALVFARTDCKWYHDYIVKAEAILFLQGRVAFVNGSGRPGGAGAGCGSILVAWGSESVKALSKMKDQGHLVLLK